MKVINERTSRRFATLLLFSWALSSTTALLFPKPAPVKALFRAVITRTTVQRKRRLIRQEKGLIRKRALLTGALLAAPTLAVGGAVAATVLANVEPLEVYTPPAGSLRGQSILITGGTAGLGLETAKRLAVGRPSHLVITARSDDKGRAAVDAIYAYLSDADDGGGAESPDNTNVSYRVLDLDNVGGIEDAVAAWSTDETFPSQFDCLINNAGVMNVPRRELTAGGVERQMASNHLGHFVFTRSLASQLTRRAKIINVSSSAHQLARKGMEFDYCWEGSPNYDGWRSYGQSKLANILFARELQRRSDAAGREWDVACLHPGAVATDLWRQVVSAESYRRVQDLAKTVEDNLPASVKEGLDGLAKKSGDLGVFKTVEQGATTSVWLASGTYKYGNDRVRTDARYYDNCTPQNLGAFATDADAAARLWRESEERAGITFDFEEASAAKTNHGEADDGKSPEDFGGAEEEQTMDEEDTEGADGASNGETKED